MKIIIAATTSTRKGTKTMIALVSWQIWMERNNYTFRKKPPSGRDMMDACSRDMEQWRLAGAKCIEPPFGDIT